jgi:mono/diheme cytochrome c family protein
MSQRPERKELEASTIRWMWAGLIFMVLLVVVFPIYRIYEPTQRAEAREVQSEFLAVSGGVLYDSQCSACHGAKGRGALAPAIGSRDFLEAVGDDQLSQLIGLGIPGTEMVSYSSDYGGPMTSTDIASITAYLRSLEEGAASNALWRTPLANSDFSGQDLFSLACTRCHGVDRLGVEDLGPDISEGSFALDESDEWLSGRIRDGFKEMPRFGGVLNDQQIDQIVDYLRGGAGAVTSTTTAPSAGQTTTTTTVPDSGNEEVLALGKLIFDVTGGGKGCAACHGFDAQGTADGPNIVGSSKAAISGAIGGGVIDMNDIKLTSDELEAVYRYLVWLTP